MHAIDWYRSRRVMLAGAVMLALVVGAITLVALKPMGAQAVSGSLTKAQIKKLVKKEVKKHPGPPGPVGPSGPPGPTGSAKVDVISARAPATQNGVPAFSRDGLTIVLNCASGSATFQTSSNDAAYAVQGIDAVGNVFHVFNGNFDAGPGPYPLLSVAFNSTTGTLLYTPSGGTPVTVVYDIQFTAVQANCILSGSATY
jgi:hypothetical protein